MLSIHNTLPASYVTRQIGIASRKQSSAMEKLSTGLRINKASDDPSGLMLSEKLQAQIEGLERAIQNTEESANLKDIMDGGLSQIQEVLNELQQLAIHSANRGVTTAEQVAADQAQMDSGLMAINKIIETTNAGGKKLLNNMESLFNSSSAVNNGINEVEDQNNNALNVLGSNISIVIKGVEDNTEELAELRFDKGQSYDDVLKALKNLDLDSLSVLDGDEDDDEGFSGKNLSLTTEALEDLLNKPDSEAKEMLRKMTGRPSSGLGGKNNLDDKLVLSDADKSLLELSNTLGNLSMGSLGMVSGVGGKIDANGNSTGYSLQDLFSGGDASLSRDPALALKILKESHKEVSNIRSQIAASRVYDDHSKEVSLTELENLTKADSRIRDADFAETITEYSMATIQAEMGSKMLSSLMDQSRMVLDLFA